MLRQEHPHYYGRARQLFNQITPSKMLTDDTLGKTRRMFLPPLSPRLISNSLYRPTGDMAASVTKTRNGSERKSTAKASGDVPDGSPEGMFLVRQTVLRQSWPREWRSEMWTYSDHIVRKTDPSCSVKPYACSRLRRCQKRFCVSTMTLSIRPLRIWRHFIRWGNLPHTKGALGGYVAHEIGMDECATDKIFVEALNNICRSHTLASRSVSSTNPGVSDEHL